MIRNTIYHLPIDIGVVGKQKLSAESILKSMVKVDDMLFPNMLKKASIFDSKLYVFKWPDNVSCAAFIPKDKEKILPKEIVALYLSCWKKQRKTSTAIH